MRNRDKPDMRIAVKAIDPVQAEGDAGATTFTFVVTRKGALRETSLEWAVEGSGRNPADATDFLGAAFPGGKLTFAAGERRKVVTVEVAGDLKVEGTESFIFRVATDDRKVHVRRDSIEASIVEDDVPPFTTLAVGEEGEVTTMALGEEAEVTTMALGEEGDPGPIATTQAVGEEGEVTTMALGEEAEVTTMALGEEGEPPVNASSTDPFGA